MTKNAIGNWIISLNGVSSFFSIFFYLLYVFYIMRILCHHLTQMNNRKKYVICCNSAAEQTVAICHSLGDCINQGFSELSWLGANYATESSYSAYSVRVEKTLFQHMSIITQICAACGVTKLMYWLDLNNQRYRIHVVLIM